MMLKRGERTTSPEEKESQLRSDICRSDPPDAPAMRSYGLKKTMIGNLVETNKLPHPMFFSG